ncbi:Auxin-induced protein 5NG4 [Hordeum vulgare]|uniref:WAT1-related protein n=1 Tax=Hordeum vulgare subsp. vulgare TaxID=112509 RepID=A0A8I6W6P5_HORVV|nr:WAT1-related protein At5g07050-like [Hordeum vulgare subsp. vulgare]KAE8809238.1 Auxin-induced protein 5NG4 [Hordeum vulgare]
MAMAMQQQGGEGETLMQRCKPYVAMISLQFGYAGMNVITKVSLNHGMSHYVLVVYRHAFATLSIAPFALVLERSKVRPRMTPLVFLNIFLLALMGPVIDQNFYYAGLKYTSPTFSCAMSNMLPAMTFVMAVIFRMEKVDLKKARCLAKVAGTLVTVAGAMLMTLYKGRAVQMVWSRHAHLPAGPHQDAAAAAKDWFKGSIFLIIATLAWASLFILQGPTLTRYNAPLTLTTLICFVGTLQAIVVTLAMEHTTDVWKIGFDMNLLAAAYAGIVTSSIAYYVQGLVIQSRGPVFASAFSPLMMIVVAIMGSFILSENIYLGGIIGSVLIVAGLYSVLWGKHKENVEKKEIEATEIPVAIKGVEGNGRIMDIVELDEVELEKAQANGKAVTISMPAGAGEAPMQRVDGEN